MISNLRFEIGCWMLWIEGFFGFVEFFGFVGFGNGMCHVLFHDA